MRERERGREREREGREEEGWGEFTAATLVQFVAGGVSLSTPALARYLLSTFNGTTTIQAGENLLLHSHKNVVMKCALLIHLTLGMFS